MNNDQVNYKGLRLVAAWMTAVAAGETVYSYAVGMNKTSVACALTTAASVYVLKKMHDGVKREQTTSPNP